MVSVVAKVVAVFAGYCKVRIGQVREFRARYIFRPLHAFKNGQGIFNGRVASRGAAAWVRQWSDRKVRECLLFQVAILVVYRIAAFVGDRCSVAKTMDDTLTLFVIGAQVYGGCAVVVRLERSVAHVAEEFLELSEAMEGGKFGVYRRVAVAIREFGASHGLAGAMGTFDW